MTLCNSPWSCGQKLDADLKGLWAWPNGVFLKPQAPKVLCSNYEAKSRHRRARMSANLQSSPPYYLSHHTTLSAVTTSLTPVRDVRIRDRQRREAKCRSHGSQRQSWEVNCAYTRMNTYAAVLPRNCSQGPSHLAALLLSGLKYQQLVLVWSFRAIWLFSSFSLYLNSRQ